MSFASKRPQNYLVRFLLPMRKAETVGGDTGKRSTQRLSVKSFDGRLEFTGTIDELLALSAEIMAGVYSWMLNSNHADWFSDPVEQETLERVYDDRLHD